MSISVRRVISPAHLLGGCVLLALLGTLPQAAAVTLCVTPHGEFGCYRSITAAVAGASSGDVVYVGPGTYHEDVVISKPLSLVAVPNTETIIDARDRDNGIFVSGLAAAPKIGLAHVLVSGFTVRNADFEGILVANANYVTLADNHVSGNNRALDIGAGSCNGIPAFETNEGDDCGEGIHLMATWHASVVRNEVDHNAGGILVTDETGPSADNLISWNHVHDNPYDCGITMASHPPATSLISTAMLPFGVRNNTVSHNVSAHNGTEQPGAGAGIGIFAPFPGTTAAGNVVIDNDVHNNGLPGITMHNHAWAPAPAPPVNLNNNSIIGNRISGNAADTADAATSGPTGINVYSVAPIGGTVISQNVFTNESIDIAFKAPTGDLTAHFNDFSRSIGVDNLGTGSIDATENWWHCLNGPGGSGGGNCASVHGSRINAVPWLPVPFNAQ
jgi:hypothetical protein